MTAEAAYFYAQRRGFKPWLKLEDWLAAEPELERLRAHGAVSVRSVFASVPTLSDRYEPVSNPNVPIEGSRVVCRDRGFLYIEKVTLEGKDSEYL
jgi:hypothetical protein